MLLTLQFFSFGVKRNGVLLSGLKHVIMGVIWLICVVLVFLFVFY